MQKDPIVAFVNSKSGGQQGQAVFHKLLRILPPNQVYDLAKGGPAVGLNAFKGQRFRVLACGGDGTVGWLLTEIDKLFTDDSPRPPVAVLPLGTGNDMSRTLRWGGSHGAKKLAPFLASVDEGSHIHLDRWRISFSHDVVPIATDAQEPQEPTDVKVMNNYFSIGADAQVAMAFHEAREANPHKFHSRVRNYAWYMRFGLQGAPSLHSTVELQIDNHAIPIPASIEALILLNIPSYAGGSRPWGRPNLKSHYGASAVDDGLLEVVGLTSNFHVATIHAKVKRGVRLGQGRHISIVTHQAVPAQIDGEPWILPPARTVITHAGTGIMLMNERPTPAQMSSPLASPSPSPHASPMHHGKPTFTRQNSAPQFATVVPRPTTPPAVATAPATAPVYDHHMTSYMVPIDNQMAKCNFTFGVPAAPSHHHPMLHPSYAVHPFQTLAPTPAAAVVPPVAAAAAPATN